MKLRIDWGLIGLIILSLVAGFGLVSIVWWMFSQFKIVPVS